MFDWNEDEEVRDTIWGVLNESEDHIVPYPKESDEEYSKKQILSSDQAKSSSNNFPSSSSLEGRSNFDSNEQVSASRFDMDPWPDLPSLNSSFGKEFIGDCARSNAIVNATDTMGNSLYHSDPASVETKDDSMKDPCGDHGNSFLDCDWGNITDFDDFDRIFRNDDSLFSNDIISHSPSMDVNNSAAPSFSTLDSNNEKGSSAKEIHGTAPSQLDHYGKRDHSSEGVERLKRSSKYRKKTEFKLPGLSFNHRDDGGQPFMGMFTSTGKLLGQPYEYPARPFSPAPAKHSSMTPQEKIEKLRRRQQMQAMLAIQQQQQQIEQKSSSTEVSVATKVIPSSSDVAIPPEGDDLQNSVLIDDSLGEKIFYQLQDAIGKLEVGVRLCIRDSLFRLSKSAVERNNASDRSSNNKSSRVEDDVPAEEEKQFYERLTKLPVETGTNPIDRVVAHLLFHWPSSEPTLRSVKEELPLPPPSPSMSFHGPMQPNQGDDLSEPMLHRENI